MVRIKTPNVHPYFLYWDVSHNAAVLRKNVITSAEVDN